MSRFFFKVDDLYESYFDKVTGNPYKYVRKIDEGGYTKNQEGFFNPASDRVLVKDFENKTEKTFVIPNNTQDIVSTFYYLRNYPTIDKLKVGESVAIDMSGSTTSNTNMYNDVDRNSIDQSSGRSDGDVLMLPLIDKSKKKSSMNMLFSKLLPPLNTSTSTTATDNKSTIPPPSLVERSDVMSTMNTTQSASVSVLSPTPLESIGNNKDLDSKNRLTLDASEQGDGKTTLSLLNELI
jgi:hypothetical protein